MLQFAYPKSKVDVLIKQKNKYLFFLISVGQDYHQSKKLEATVNLFENLIKCCVVMSDDETLDSQKRDVAKGDWHFTICIADSLQAYNEAEYDNQRDMLKEKWNQSGKLWQETYENLFNQLIAAANKKIKVKIKFIHWDALLSEGIKKFQFQDKNEYLHRVYQSHTMFFNNVNKQGNLHRNRRILKDSQFAGDKNLIPDGVIESTPLSNNARTYILEELVLLLDCCAYGLGVDESEWDVSIHHPQQAFIVYPGDEGYAFKHAPDVLKDFNLEMWNKHRRLNLQWFTVDLHDKQPALTGESAKLQGCNDLSITASSEFLRSQMALFKRIFLGLNRESELAATRSQDLIKGKTVTVDLPAYNEILSVNRLALLNELSVHLDQSPALIRPTKLVSIVACHGLGGVGKSHLAWSFAKSKIHGYSLICWISGNKEITPQYKKLGEKLQLFKNNSRSSQSKESRVKQYFENELQNWLIIFDDVNDMETVKPFIPQCGGHVIITTRNNDLTRNESSVIPMVKVDVMQKEEAIEFLRKVTKREDIPQSDYEVLAERLGWLPLALELAGSYLEKNRSVIVAEYLQFYQQRFDELMGNNEFRINANKHAIAAISISIRAIRAETTASDYGIELLYACSYLMAHDIPIELLKKILARSYHHVLTLESFTYLIKYSLVFFSQDNQFINLHPVVHDTLRFLHQDEFKKAADKKSFQDKFAELILSAAHYINDVVVSAGEDDSHGEGFHSAAVRLAHRHHLAVFKHFKTLNIECRTLESKLLTANAMLLGPVDTEGALPLLDEVQAAYISQGIPNTHDYVNVLQQKANAYKHKGDFVNAIHFFKQALELIPRVNDVPVGGLAIQFSKLPNTIKLELAECMSTSGNYPAAINNLKELENEDIDSSKKGHVWYLLGFISLKLKDYTEAYRYAQLSYSILEANFGRNHYLTQKTNKLILIINVYQRRTDMRREQLLARFNEGLDILLSALGVQSLTGLSIPFEIALAYAETGNQTDSFYFANKMIATLKTIPNSQLAMYSRLIHMLINIFQSFDRSDAEIKKSYTWLRIVDLLNVNSVKEALTILVTKKDAYKDLTKDLIAENPDLIHSVVSPQQPTLLHIAVTHECVDKVVMLLQAKSPYDIPDQHGKTAIDLAIASNIPNILRQFKRHLTSQYRAAELTDAKLVRNLANNGDHEGLKLMVHLNKACIDQPNSEGLTALHYAVQYAVRERDTRAMTVLLEAACSPTHKNPKGTDAFSYAANDTDIIALLCLYEFDSKNQSSRHLTTS